MSRKAMLVCLTSLYFICINVCLVLIVYHKSNVAFHESKFLKNGTPARQLAAHASPPTSTTCTTQADLFIAVVPQKQEKLYSSSSATYNRLLFDLERATRNRHVYFLLLVSLDTFHPVHRLWCKNTSPTQQCKLMVLDDTEGAETYLHAVQQQGFCTSHFLVFSEEIKIDASFMNRLTLIPAHKVSCLLKAPRELPNTCPALAYNVPINFTISSSQVPQDEAPATLLSRSIWTSAIKQNLYAGNFAVTAHAQV